MLVKCAPCFTDGKLVSEVSSIIGKSLRDIALPLAVHRATLFLIMRPDRPFCYSCPGSPGSSDVRIRLCTDLTMHTQV